MQSRKIFWGSLGLKWGLFYKGWLCILFFNTFRWACTAILYFLKKVIILKSWRRGLITSAKLRVSGDHDYQNSLKMRLNTSEVCTQFCMLAYVILSQSKKHETWIYTREEEKMGGWVRAATFYETKQKMQSLEGSRAVPSHPCGRGRVDISFGMWKNIINRWR